MFEKLPPTPKKKNYYEFFGVKQNATEEELHRAYRRKAKLYHPDVGGTNTEHSKRLAEQFKQLQEVYSILKDPKKRAEYDKAIHPKITMPPKSIYPKSIYPKPIYRPPIYPRQSRPAPAGNRGDAVEDLARDIFGWGKRSK